MIDEPTEFGSRVVRHLREEHVVVRMRISVVVSIVVLLSASFSAAT